MDTSEHSADIKTEVFEIVDAFNLGSLIQIFDFQEVSKPSGYVLTQFETTLGIYNHFYKIKD